jgi:hypothetical protein
LARAAALDRKRPVTFSDESRMIEVVDESVRWENSKIAAGGRGLI